jgi:hypothetical protein
MKHHSSGRSRRRVAVALIATALFALVGTVVGAPAQARPVTGPQLDLLNPPLLFPEESPFFVNHGLCAETAEERIGLLKPSSRFELTVDGSPVHLKTTLELTPEQIDNPAYTACKLFSVTFRHGLAEGVHEFVGCWYYVGENLGCEDVKVTFD